MKISNIKRILTTAVLVMLMLPYTALAATTSSLETQSEMLPSSSLPPSQEMSLYPSDFDLIKYLNDNPNDYQKIWEPWLSKAAVHAIVASDDGEFLAVGGGYLYDNEVHIFRWNPETLEYDRVWDSGDGLLERDVLSLAWGDTDNNNFMEVVAGSADGHVYVFEQKHIYDPYTNTENQFEHVWTSPRMRPVFSLKIDDTDKDYIPDILVGAWDGAHVFEYKNHSGYPFSKEHLIEYEEVWNSGDVLDDLLCSITSGDINHNGLPDIIAGTRNGTIYIFENDGVVLDIEGNPFPLTNDNNYKLNATLDGYMWKPVTSLDAGNLDADPNDEILAVALGQGVYVIDYTDSEDYVLQKLTRPLESWEVTESTNSLDYFVDSNLNATNVFYVDETSVSPEDVEEPDYGPFGGWNTAMAVIDGKVSRFRPPNATALLDFGIDEEATGSGNDLPDLTVRFLKEPHVTPFGDEAGFASFPNFTNLKFYVSQDRILFTEVSDEDLDYENTTEGFLVFVNLDNILYKNRWDYVQYLNITVSGNENYAVDAVQAGTLYRPLDTATVAGIRRVELDNSDMIAEFKARLNAYATGNLSLLDFDYEEEPNRIVIGTVDGRLIVFAYDDTGQSYFEMWDSYLGEAPLGSRPNMFNLKTNIWAIQEVKTKGKIPTWLATEDLEKVSDPPLSYKIPYASSEYSSMAFTDVNRDKLLDVIIGTKQGALKCPTNPTVELYFVNVNTNYFDMYNEVWLSATFGQLNETRWSNDRDELIVGYVEPGETTGNPAEDTFVGVNAGLDYWSFYPGTYYTNPKSLADLEVTGELARILNMSAVLPKAALADMDGDGDLDVTVTNGRIYYLENIGSITDPSFALKHDYYHSINVEGPRKVFSSPQHADFDLDGDLDLVVGFANKYGATYFENAGTAESPVWVEKKRLFSNPKRNFKLHNFTDPIFYNTKSLFNLLGDLEVNVKGSNFTVSKENFLKAYEETFGTTFIMSAYNNETEEIVTFLGDTESHSRFILGTNPRIVRLEVALANGPLWNYGYHVFETWNNDDELDEWTITVETGNVDNDRRNEVIVGDYDNNLYVFEHLVNNTYKRAFRSFDFNHTVESDESPYKWEELEGLSGNFNRIIWDHVENLIVDTDLDNDTLREIIATADLSIYVFEQQLVHNKTIDDEFTLVWREDLRKSMWGGNLEEAGFEKVTALSYCDDIDYNEFSEIIVAVGSYLFVYESHPDGTFEEVYFSDAPLGRYLLPGNPIALPSDVDAHTPHLEYSGFKIHAVATGDTDSDGFKEIVVGGIRNQELKEITVGVGQNITVMDSGQHGFVGVLENHIGTYQLTWTAPDTLTYLNPVNTIVIDDQDYDGRKELIIGHKHGIDVWEWNGTDNEYTKMEVITSSPNYPVINLTSMFFPEIEGMKFSGRNTDIIQLSNGTIIQIYTRDQRLFIKSSDDNGTTWTTEKRLTDDTEYNNTIRWELEPSIAEVDWKGTRAYNEVWFVWRTIEGDPWYLPLVSIYARGYYYNQAESWWTPVYQIVSVMNPVENVIHSPTVTSRPSTIGKLSVSYINVTDGRVHSGGLTLIGVPPAARWVWFFGEPLPYIGSDLSFRYEASTIDMISLRGGGYVLAFAGRFKNESKGDYDIWVMTTNATGGWNQPVRLTSESTDEGNPSITQLKSEDGTLVVLFEAYGGVREETIQICYSKDMGRTWSSPEPIPSLPSWITTFTYEGNTYYRIELTLAATPTSIAPRIAARKDEGFIYSLVIHTYTLGPFGKIVWQDIVVGTNPSSKWTQNEMGSVQVIAVGDTDSDGRREIVADYGNKATLFELARLNSSHQNHAQAWTSQELPEPVTDISIGDPNGNGWQEIIISAKRGNVYSYEITNTDLPKTSLMAPEILSAFQVSSQSITSMKVGNFDGDTEPDIVTGSEDTNVIASRADGTLIWNFSDPAGGILDLAVADLNGDGIDDVVAGVFAEFNQSGVVSNGTVYAINGTTGTQLWKFESSELHIGCVQTADLNGDGTRDVVAGSWGVGGFGEDRVYAFDGATGIHLWNATLTSAINGLGVGNLKGDSDAEVVAVCGDGFVYALNGENGSLLWPFQDVESWLNRPSISDFNGDGFGDVGTSGSAIFALDGPTGSQLWNNTAVAGRPSMTTEVADLNGDGTPDLIAGYYAEPDASETSSEIIAVDGLTGQILWTYNITNNQIYYLTTGDFNGDGIIDVASTHQEDSLTDQGVLVALSGLYGTVSWVFKTPSEDGFWPLRALTASDFNQDGVDDVVVGTELGNVYVVHGAPIGAPPPPQPVRILEPAWDITPHATGIDLYSMGCMATGDFNGDGIDDIASTGGDLKDYEPHIYTVSGNNGEKLWEYNTTDAASAIVAANLTGQGHLDVIVGTFLDKIYAFEGSAYDQGNLTWEVDSSEYIITNLATANLDSDEKEEIVGIGLMGAGTHIIYHALAIDDNGDMLWKYPFAEGPLAGTWWDLFRHTVKTGDIDGDEFDEIVVLSNNTVYAIDESGDETLWNFSVPTGPLLSLDFGHLVNPTKEDIVVSSFFDGTIYAIDGFKGKSLWNFSAPRVLSVGVGKFRLETSTDDVVALLYGSQIVSIDGKSGKKNWAFENPTICLRVEAFGLESYRESVLTGDTNGDRLDEIIVINWDRVYAVNRSGVVWSSSALSYGIAGIWLQNCYMLGNFDGDQYADVAVGTYDGHLYAIFCMGGGTVPIGAPEEPTSTGAVTSTIDNTQPEKQPENEPTSNNIQAETLSILASTTISLMLIPIACAKAKLTKQGSRSRKRPKSSSRT